jgi:hypothetical protein
LKYIAAVPEAAASSCTNTPFVDIFIFDEHSSQKSSDYIRGAPGDLFRHCGADANNWQPGFNMLGDVGAELSDCHEHAETLSSVVLPKDIARHEFICVTHEVVGRLGSARALSPQLVQEGGVPWRCAGCELQNFRPRERGAELHAPCVRRAFEMLLLAGLFPQIVEGPLQVAAIAGKSSLPVSFVVGSQSLQ